MCSQKSIREASRTVGFAPGLLTHTSNTTLGEIGGRTSVSSRPSLNYRKIVFSNELKMCVRESWAFWVAKAVFVEVRRELFLSAGIEHSMQTYHQPPKGGLLKRTSVKERRGGGNLTGWLLSLCDTPL